MTFSFCEPVWATTTSRIHIRDLEGGELKVGGGIDTPTLCGRMMNYGWDLAQEVTQRAIETSSSSPYGATCERCAQEWARRESGVPKT